MPDLPNHKRFDCHMHTPLCGHAEGDTIEYVDAASENGISLITFTCHIPMREDRFAQEGIRMRLNDMPRYRKMVEEARVHGESKGVEVLYGIEAEIHPDEEAMVEMEALIQSEPFDFVLGSLHHMLPAFRDWLAANNCTSDAEKIREYFKCLGQGAASGRYHSLSHPDVIRVYSTLEGQFDPVAYEPEIQAFLDVVAQSDVCLEINTSGLIKGDFVVHPDPLIMQWALDRKIPFTIGSDSHTPARVGMHFEEVIEEYRELGLKELHYFRGGQRQTVGI
ncbi:histidinol-phosphatase [Puniceicoccales bacterium CK1056]|uniref:Histidinol-phosphatase n=1 Tax=Oceanipulchritudo coccoides TaxID=2706888 RepID=A0A6B2LZL5_9BACT|nr:histidinol-phosphatase [Oceanipulchritudo coccoides]NDV60945.1 histidinol-phosphatase [Oceanipulchritudo coccoides]